MTMLPGLKKRVGTELVTVAKELNSYGEITESKVFRSIFESFCTLSLS